MLNSLHVRGYRGFKDFRMEGLRRVNLLVGKNNSGKTSLLEAAQLHVTGGDVAVFHEIPRRRGEVHVPDIFEETRLARSRAESLSDASHFFYGHEFSEFSSIEIGSDNTGKTVVSTIAINDEDEESEGSAGLRVEGLNRLAIEIHHAERIVARVPLLTRSGAFEIPRFFRSRNSQAEKPVQFVESDLIDTDRLGAMWDQVLEQIREADVVRAIQILDSDIDSIAFLGPATRKISSRGGILVGSGAGTRRLPIGSYGEGMRRMLALGTALATTSGGYLLVDEIDTGLHWTVLADMWRLVIDTAKRFAIQVFATTHSLDCLRALDETCRQHPELADDIAVHTIHSDLDHAITSNADDLQVSLRHEIEVRG